MSAPPGMPRRKKTEQSPTRLPGGPPEGGSLGHSSGHPPPHGYSSAMGGNFPASSSAPAVRDSIVRSMQEVFAHLEPGVVHMVLSECDFRVENAMDALLELSEDAAPIPPPVSGFERTAAALLSPSHFSEPRPDSDSSKPSQEPSSPPSTGLLTEELDLLVDQELETLTAQQDADDEHHSSKYLSAAEFLPSFPPPPFPQQALPELLQSSLESGSREPSAKQPSPAGGLLDHMSGASSPLDQLSMWEDQTTEGQQSVVDFTHLMTETSADKPKPPLDLAASGRPSAFQVYKKHLSSDMLPDAIGGARSKVNTLSREPLSCMSTAWNLAAPVFSPRIHGNQRPAFITPVAQTVSNWSKHASPWLSQGPVSQAPLKPSAPIPTSWTTPSAPQFPARHSRLRLEGKVLVLLRGAPGSGKSTVARAFLQHHPGGVTLSTDDYFTCNGDYRFDPTALGEAHEWNHKRAKEAFERGANPIIIDNTNMQGWEMKPYVAQALKHGYKVLFREPDTWWKNKPRELERRSTHNIPVEKIRRMLSGYERFVTVQSIMGSQMPESKRLILENRGSRPVSSEAPCPDLVGRPGLTEGRKQPRSQLFSSLPDVSSVGRSGEVGMLEDGTHKSTESLNFQVSGGPTENNDISDRDDDIDLGELDSQLDAQLDLNHPIGDQRIPDCIVESVMNEDHCGKEMPVAFSESIGQRVKRERPSRRSGFDKMEPADLVKDTTQSDSKAKEKEEEAGRVGMERHGEEKGPPKMLHFVGDWPCEGSLKQRQVRERRKEDEGASRGASEHEKGVRSGPDITEFQKLLDLIQTGVAPVQASCSRSQSLSPSSGEELEIEDEAGDTLEELHSCRSSSEEGGQNITRVKSNRGDLPDCVLDWKAAESGVIRELRNDEWEELKIKNEASTTGRKTAASEVGTETLSVEFKSATAANSHSGPADSLLICRTVEANVRPDGVACRNIAGEAGTNEDTNTCTEICRETGTEADGSHVSEACEGSVETESSAFSSQERRQHQRRRSGKQCKLALTFTQNSPVSAAQNTDSSQNSSNSDVKPDFDPDCATCLDIKPNFDPFAEFKSEAHLQPPLLSLADTGCFSQTEPQDFALLWRLNHQDSSDDAFAIAGSHSGDITVLDGDFSRFVPGLSSAVSAAGAVHPSGHREVPYRVVHEKGTLVEEREFGVTQDRLESLRILSRHFKLVSFDTLEDLYDKCHQDLEWTTNLLLDSGERFFRDEEEDSAADEGDHNAFSLSGALCEAAETRLCPSVLDEQQHEECPTGIEGGPHQSTCEAGSESGDRSNNTDVACFGGAAGPAPNREPTDTTSDSEQPPQTELILPEAAKEGETCDNTECKEPDLEGGAWGGSFGDGVIIEESRVEIEDEIASMDEVNRLLQAELEEMEREEKQRKEERRSQHLDIQSVELKLPTELALQLTELFGPVGVDPDTCSTDDYAVQMDLNLAKLLHQAWKETIQERQRQAALSFHLLQESSVHWGDSQVAKPRPRGPTQAANFLISTDGYMSLDSQPEACGQMPFMDHWNVTRPHVSLRDIIKEEQALQETVQKTRQSRADLDRRDGAALLKENQLYSLFPTIDRHFLQDIFRDHNYSLAQTELFLHGLLNEEPVKTVIAPEAPRTDHHRAASRDREKRQKPLELAVPDYQDTDDPEYEDFRAEASLQRRRQLESFAKAAEAHKQGRKEVASFYAQQGHLHGQRMREANHRAAVQIFERVNSSLLPSNILDLHGLHVDEALEHLAQVLQDKTTECEQGLCRPQLSVITGRGNHSQGGVARIRPAVIDYLTNKHYRFAEPKPGLVLVSLT